MHSLTDQKSDERSQGNKYHNLAFLSDLRFPAEVSTDVVQNDLRAQSRERKGGRQSSRGKGRISSKSHLFYISICFYLKNN